MSRRACKASSGALLGNLLGRLSEGGNVDHQVSSIHVRGHADGIAASLIANRGNVNRGSAVPAHDVLPFLAVAFRAANPAGIQRYAPAIGLLDDHEAQGLAARADGEK